MFYLLICGERIPYIKWTENELNQFKNHFNMWDTSDFELDYPLDWQI